MKTVCLIALLLVSLIAISFTAVLAQEATLTAADVFPYDIVAESYVPSLYFSGPQSEAERLVTAPDFPYATLDLCYCPSLYYEAWKVKAVQAMR